MVAVIDGAVKASLSAIICLILLVSSDFNSSGVSATIVGSHSSDPGVAQDPASANASNKSMAPGRIPPP